MRGSYGPVRRFAAAAVAVVVSALMLSTEVLADRRSDSRRADRNDADSRVSPVFRIKRDKRSHKRDNDAARPIDGSRNNLGDAEMNATDTPLRRLMPNGYADGSDAMAGLSRPWPRTVSNIVFAQSADRPNSVGASDFVWQWGQFIDHDIDLTDGTDPPESFPIVIPPGDTVFPPGGGIDFNRSIYTYDARGIRQQINEITGWIDASMVYGSDEARAEALRESNGTGRLKTSGRNLLPTNVAGLANAGGSNPTLFLAGDVRSNEQIGLTALHTLFMREHNRLANLFWSEAQRRDSADDGAKKARTMYRYKDRDGNTVYSDRPPDGGKRAEARKPDGRSGSDDSTPDGDEIYERARAIVAAEIQHITYTEFLPVLLGPRAMGRYSGYRSGLDARVMNEFSAAAFRIGHSMLSSTLLRIDADGQEIAFGHIPLRNAFFAPDQLRAHGIEPLLRGLAAQTCQQVDAFVIDEVRNFLFGDPGLGGLDLVSLNIQRGRDHGLPDYNSARVALGLRPVTSFEDISSNPETVARLRQAYDDVDEIDLWVGGLAESPIAGGMVGELMHTIIRMQFEALRDGDRFWYTRVLSREDIELVESLSLADIIRLNSSVRNEIQDNVFIARPPDRGRRRR